MHFLAGRGSTGVRVYSYNMTECYTFYEITIKPFVLEVTLLCIMLLVFRFFSGKLLLSWSANSQAKEALFPVPTKLYLWLQTQAVVHICYVTIYKKENICHLLIHCLFLIDPVNMLRL